MKSFFEELKKRRVYRVAVAYIIAGSAIVQLAGTVFPIFHAPDWAQQVFVVVIAFGFPIALVLAWSFDIKQGAIVKAPEADRTAASSRRMWVLAGAGWLIAALALAGYWFWHPWRPGPPAPGTEVVSVAADKSIAVLPFENLSDEKENAFFTEGVADEILTDLAKIADLKVINRAATRGRACFGRQCATGRWPRAGKRAADRCPHRRTRLGRTL
ncbi:MAG: hypothetical protein DME34_06090 [Verrucomicrobia bacterium]|nr:MAG: hypothetical protein DME34_06090 [Verrucomicrobiota bacterium]